VTRSGASALIIGNEVLSAKVKDSNGPLLIERLRARGIALELMLMVPDEVDAIVEALVMARAKSRWVVTSGGIGPTHDDVTVRAVALALNRRVVQHPQMLELLREAFGSTSIPASALRIAEAPEGSRLIGSPNLKYPVLAVDDIFLLPGVPELFALQLQAVLETLPGEPVVSRAVFLDAFEHEIAPALDAAALSEPDVEIGSYPTFDPKAGYRVKVTVEHLSKERVNATMNRLVKSLPESKVVRLEDER
jgi:molybdenum cofactor synthesis domain-containing protein